VAIPFPIPRLAPVIIAVFPSSNFMIVTVKINGFKDSEMLSNIIP
jgi:hypothetical protein